MKEKNGKSVGSNQEIFEEAKKRVEARIGFYIHTGIALGVIALLTVINLVTQTDYLWFKWPALGLGLSILFHWIGINSHKLTSLKEKMVRAEMNKQS